ncbi:MAG: hypothetical protein JNL05_06025 [Flavobacteriales bacterium]|nr:hypothetical protein [Flavobacteriales bacterium]
MHARRSPAGPLILGGCALLLLAAAWLARHAHPMGDDLAFAATGRTGGFLQLQVERWLLWNGRFSSNIPILGSPLVQGLDGLAWYRACAPLLIGLTLLAFRSLVRATSPDAPARDAWSGALVLTALDVALMPDIAEGIYWYTGSMTYQTAVITGTWYAALWWRMRQGRWWVNKGVHTTAAALALAAFIGTNEVSMAMAVLFHGAVVLGRITGRTVLTGPGLTLVVIAVLASALMFLAPGNAGREWQYTGTRQFGYSLAMSAAQALRFTARWAASPVVLGGAALLLLGFDRLPVWTRELAARARPYRWPLLLLPPALVFVSAYPAYWSTGMLGQHRTIDQAWGFAVPAWALAALALAPMRRSDPSRRPAWAANGLALLVSVSLLATGNGLRVMGDLLSGDAQRFDAEMAARFKGLEAARSSASTVVRVPALNTRPRALLVMDLSGEPWYWVNVAHAQYFGIMDKRIVRGPKTNGAR